jgi:hypothetical protein
MPFLGFQKAFQRGFEPDDEVVRLFLIKVRSLPRPMKSMFTRPFQESDMAIVTVLIDF